MYYGNEQEMYEGGQSQMYEWCNQGADMVSDDFADDPSYMDFVGSQFERFNIPITQMVAEELFKAVARNVCYVIAHHESYLLYWDCSDVNITDEWKEVAYEITDPREPDFSHEADPELIETYRLIEGQDEEFFDEYIQKPGLKALPDHVYWAVEVVVDDIDIGGYQGFHEWMNDDATRGLEELCLVKDLEGNLFVDRDRLKAYHELAIWAAILWVMGPLAKEWRYKNIDLFRLCYDHGSCILYESLLYSPEYYTTIMRPPKSCHICGVHSWCVELTQDGEATRFICEGCLNGAFSKEGSGRCGTKRCGYVQCPNHPEHTMDEYGYLNHLRGHGQLRGLAGKKSGPMFGSTDRKLLK